MMLIYTGDSFRQHFILFYFIQQTTHFWDTHGYGDQSLHDYICPTGKDENPATDGSLVVTVAVTTWRWGQVISQYSTFISYLQCNFMAGKENAKHNTAAMILPKLLSSWKGTRYLGAPSCVKLPFPHRANALYIYITPHNDGYFASHRLTQSFYLLSLSAV